MSTELTEAQKLLELRNRIDAIDDDIARLGIERLDHLGQQDGGVGRGHAAPPALAAIT